MRKTLATLAFLCAFALVAIGVASVMPNGKSAEKAVQNALIASTVSDLTKGETVNAQGAAIETDAGSESGSEPTVVTTSDGTQYAQNQLLLVVDGASSLSDVSSALADKGASDIEFSLIMDGLSDGSSIVKATYTGAVDAVGLGDDITGSAGISSAEPNYVSHLDDVDDEADEANEADEADEANEADDAATTAANSATISELSSTTINDPSAGLQWMLSSVKAYDAWDSARVSGNTTVVVIDSGVDYDHPDLVDNLILGDYAKNTYTEKTGGAAVDDEVGHGTHVSGIIAATANNAEGIAGLSYNAKILPIKASYTTKGDLFTEDIIEGIEYALDLKADSSSPDYLQNIRVINMSLGMTTYYKAYEQAVNKAYKAGVLVVAAAGNKSKSTIEYPAAFDNAIAVTSLKASAGSVGTFDSSYSNYGSAATLAAPGTAVYSTYLDGSYKSLSGTSMATPVVSAAAALLFSTYMSATPSQVRSALEQSAVDLGATGWDKYYGYGALDVSAAISKLDETFEHTHVAGEAIHENEIEVSCTEEGSYDLVTRCTVCNKVMSSEHFTEPALGHDWGAWKETAYPTKYHTGSHYHICNRCGKIEIETIPKIVATITRLAGDNAFGTMSAIVDSGWEAGSCSRVVLATFDGYWDALSAAGLAGAYDCPVLLTSKSDLSEEARDEIVRLGATEVIIAGGTSAISAQVEDQVKELDCTVVRVAGSNAIGTSIAIYDTGAELGAWGETCIVATVSGYYDALSASPYSYAEGAPIFLSNADGSISSQVVDAIKAGGFTCVVIAGGESCVTDEAADALADATGATIDRRAGETCFETSLELANLCLEAGMGVDGLGFSTGLHGYWDALSAAALMGKNRTPILLIDDDHQQTLAFLKTYSSEVDNVCIFGGTNAVSVDTRNSIAKILGLE